MKAILVTGGAGFIGSNYIHYMLKHDKETKIINYDLLTYAGHIGNLSDVKDHERYVFIKGDILNSELLEQIFVEYNIEAVINFAAETHVDRSIDVPRTFVETNILGTQVLLETSKKYWQINCDEQGYPIYKTGVKFIQVSTDEVYGTLGSTGSFSEDSPIVPNSPYASSKAGADMMVRAYYKTYKLPINITRCSNNYGPNQFPEKLIPLMIYKALNNNKMPVYGDGLQVRDWLHVMDHCEALYIVWKKGVSGEVYNIGGSNEKTNIDIVKYIIKYLNKSETLIDYVDDRLGHDRRYAINHKKLTNNLGWNPQYSFENGLKETIDWYVKHSTFYDV